MAEISNDRQADRLLKSWKEIAAFFGKDERTVKRWEASRGLPVRRIPGGNRTSVFAYASELEDWLTGNAQKLDVQPLATALPAAAVAGAHSPIFVLPWPYLGLVATAVFLLGLAASALFPNLWSGTTTAPTRSVAYTPSLEAHELYLEAAYLWEKRTPDSLRQAEALFQRATEIDPRYAQAFAGLANTYNLLREYSVMPAAEAYAAAVEAGRQAVALDPADADALSALAFAEFYGLRLLSGGLARFEQARTLDPQSPKIRHWLANALLHLGRFAEALVEIEEAQRLDPSSRSIRASKGLALFCAGRIAEAVALLDELARLEPDFLSPHAYLAYVYLAQGDYPAYLSELRIAGTLREDASRVAVAEAGRRGLAENGRSGMVEAMLAEERRQVEVGKSLLYNIARLEALAGDSRSAVNSLRASLAAGEEHVMGLNIDPAFRLIRTNTEFRAFAARFGLPIVQ